MKTNSNSLQDNILIHILPLIIFDGTHVDIRWQIKNAFVCYITGLGFVKKNGRSYIIADQTNPYITITAITRNGVLRKKIKYKVHHINKKIFNIDTSANICPKSIKQYSTHFPAPHLRSKKYELNEHIFNKTAKINQRIDSELNKLLDENVFSINTVARVKQATEKYITINIKK